MERLQCSYIHSQSNYTAQHDCICSLKRPFLFYYDVILYKQFGVRHWAKWGSWNWKNFVHKERGWPCRKKICLKKKKKKNKLYHCDFLIWMGEWKPDFVVDTMAPTGIDIKSSSHKCVSKRDEVIASPKKNPSYLPASKKYVCFVPSLWISAAFCPRWILRPLEERTEQHFASLVFYKPLNYSHSLLALGRTHFCSIISGLSSTVVVSLQRANFFHFL